MKGYVVVGCMLTGFILVNGVVGQTTAPLLVNAVEQDEPEKDGLLPDIQLDDGPVQPPATKEEKKVEETLPEVVEEKVEQEPSRWVIPPQVAVEVVGAPKQVQGMKEPPFVVEVVGKQRDWTGLWWDVNRLRIEVVSLGPNAGGGVRLPWQGTPWGGYGVIFRGRIPVPVKQQGQSAERNRFLIIEQGVVLGKDDRGWVLQGSPAQAHLEEQARNEERANRVTLVELSENRGAWAVRVPKEGVLLRGWVGTMLDACRGGLAEGISNEALRKMLGGVGDVEWLIIPRTRST